MRTDRIDFISAYCDRWCERCAFTERCATFAARCALAMCEDSREALELAAGRPREAHPDAGPPTPPSWLSEFDQQEPTAEEAERYEREERARDTRIEESPVMHAATAYMTLVHHWLQAEHETLVSSVDEALKRHSPGTPTLDQQAMALDAREVRNALEVVAWDHMLLTVKLHRAMKGRDRNATGEDAEDHPVQNDWNGSAKVALICIDRSEEAWRVIARWVQSSSDLPIAFADHLAQLRRDVEWAFPRARAFVRPGFDRL